MALRLATKRIFLICLLVSLSCTAILGLLAWPLGPGPDGELFATALFTALYSLAAFGAAVPFDRGHHPLVAGMAIGLILLAFTQTIPLVWIDFLQRWEDYEKATVVTAVLGGLGAHFSLISMAQPARKLRWLQLLTMWDAALLAGLIIAYMLFDARYPVPGWWETGIFFAGVLGVCGTLAIPLLHVLNRVQTAERVETLDLQMVIVCPRCNLQQTVTAGHSTCSGCKLRFKIEIEEPRCEKCGYLLYQLTENRCPECGAVFETYPRTTPA